MLPEHVNAKAMEAYYGGRAALSIRHWPVPVIGVDYTSQYAAVLARSDLWAFVIAEQIHWTKPKLGKVRDLIGDLDANELLKPETWPMLNMFVKIQPDADLLPVRAQYAVAGQPNVALTFRSGAPQWFTVVDAVVSTLLRGRPPKILDAIAVHAGDPQPGLQVAYLGLGDEQVRLDPYTCIPVVLVELRARLKAKRVEAERRGEMARVAQLRGHEQAVKAMVNSLYGIAIELNIVNHSEARDIVTVRADGTRFASRQPRSEIPGTFYEPAVASLVAGGGRGLLGLAQHLVEQEGGTFAFCDTDSLAIVATPAGGPIACPGGPSTTANGEDAVSALSHHTVQRIVDKLDALNPYDPELIPRFLKIEYGLDAPTMCFGVASKRYALYDRDPAGRVRLVNRSEHGLGHLLPPDGLSRSEFYDAVWEHIIANALGEPAREPSWFKAPALGQLTATTPTELKNFDPLNDGKPYHEQVRPMNWYDIAHPRGTADGEIGSGILFAPNGTKPTEPLWFDRERPGATTALTTMDPMYVIDGRTPVESYGSLTYRHGRRAEAKAVDSHGRPSTGATKGLLNPPHINAVELERCGKEANRFNDTTQALDPRTADTVTRFPEPLCPACGTEIDHRNGRRYCNDTCRKRHARAQRNLTTA